MLLLKIIRYSIAPTVISLIILYLCCFIQVDNIPEIEVDSLLGIPMDKIVHFCMYLGLSGTTALFYIYDKKGEINILALIIGAFVLPIIYGGFIEILQHNYFPNRSGDTYDFLADIVGSLAALPIALWFKSYCLKKYAQ